MLESLPGLSEGLCAGRKARAGGMNGGKAIYVPYMQALVIPNSIQSDSKQAGGVESNSQTGPGHLKAQFHVGIRAVVDPQQIDDTGGRANGNQAWCRGRPVISGQGRHIIVL